MLLWRMDKITWAVKLKPQKLPDCVLILVCALIRHSEMQWDNRYVQHLGMALGFRGGFMYDL